MRAKITSPLQDLRAIRGDIEARIHARNRLAASRVIKLCEQEGFGFVMHVAAEEWAKREPEGAHTTGPCKVFTKKCPCKTRHGCDKCYGCGWVLK